MPGPRRSVRFAARPHPLRLRARTRTLGVLRGTLRDCPRPVHLPSGQTARRTSCRAEQRHATRAYAQRLVPVGALTPADVGPIIDAIDREITRNGGTP